MQKSTISSLKYRVNMNANSTDCPVLSSGDNLANDFPCRNQGVSYAYSQPQIVQRLEPVFLSHNTFHKARSFSSD